MVLTIACPRCRAGCRVQAALEGKLVRCPSCQETFTVPLPGRTEDVPMLELADPVMPVPQAAITRERGQPVALPPLAPLRPRSPSASVGRGNRKMLYILGGSAAGGILLVLLIVLLLSRSTRDDRSVARDGRDEPPAAGNPQARPVVIQAGRTCVCSVAFSPDSKLLVTGDGYFGPGQAQLWNLPGGGHQRTLPLEGSQVYSVDFARTGLLATGSDRGVDLWDRSGKHLASLSGHRGYVRSVVFSADGSRLASSSDEALLIWDVKGQRLQQRLTDYRGPSTWRISTAMAFSPDGRWLASGSEPSTAKIWKADSGELVASLRHPGVVIAVAFSPDGQLLATAGFDGHVRLFDTREFRSVGEFAAHTDWVFSVTFSPSGKLLATGGREGGVKIWHVASRKNVVDIASERGNRNEVWSVRFSPDGELFAASRLDGTVRLWRLADLLGQTD